MSFDLGFWKYARGTVTANQESVYRRLNAGQHVDGLVDLPINQFISELQKVFRPPDWKEVEGKIWEGPVGSFQILAIPQFIQVACWNLPNDALNHIIAIADRLHLPMFDPQGGQRFEPPFDQPANEPTCSFCGRSKSAVSALIESTSARICGDCVREANTLVFGSNE